MVSSSIFKIMFSFIIFVILVTVMINPFGINLL